MFLHGKPPPWTEYGNMLLPDTKPDIMIIDGAANYENDVYLDGKKLRKYRRIHSI